MKGTTIDWALWAGAGVLALVALGLLLWALFWNRSRGRKRCPRCWYPMDGVTVGTDLLCPECGHDAGDARRLHRTRRKWRWTLVAAFLGMIAYGLGITPRVMKKGWPSAIPSTVLVTVWPVPVGDWVAKNLDEQVVNDAVVLELNERILDNSLPQWQLAHWRGRVESYLRDQKRFGITTQAAVLKRLGEKRVTLTIDAERLDDTLKVLEREFGVPIVVDWAALEPESMTPNMLVSLSLVSANGLDAIDTLLGGYMTDMLSPVQWPIEGDRIVVGVRDLNTKVLPVCSYDLVLPALRNEQLWATDSGFVFGLEERVAHVERLLTTFIEPEKWVDGGGNANALVMLGTHALVRAPARIHAQITPLLDALNRALDTPGGAASESEAEWKEVIVTRAKLRSTSLTFQGGSISVKDLIEAMQTATGCTFHADWPSLAWVRVQPDLPVNTVSTPLTGEQVLDRLVNRLVERPLARASWTISRNVVRVGAEVVMDRLQVVRFYNVLDLLPESLELFVAENSGKPYRDVNRPLSPWIEDASSTLRRLIEQTIDPEGWVDSGGDSGMIDGFGPLLVIKTNVRNHLAIEDLLSKLRAAKKHADSEPARRRGE